MRPSLPCLPGLSRPSTARLVRLACVLVPGALMLAALPRVRAEKPPQTEINLVVDMTPEGRKITRPDAQHPQYYFPWVGGFVEEGASIAGEPPPPPKRQVVREIAKMLASQGYLLGTNVHPPTMIVNLHWGSMNADADTIADDDPDNPQSPTFFNQRRMIALVAGNTDMNIDTAMERTEVYQKISEDRFFVVIDAYDFQTFMKSRKKVLLWRAKVSVPSTGLAFSSVLKDMLDATAPQLGIESKHIKTVIKDLPIGHVTVGPTEEVPDNGPATSPSKK